MIHNNGAALSVHLGGPSVVEDITFRDIRIEYDASEMESILQRERDQKVECKSPWSGRWLDVSNYKMFAAGSMYTESIGLDVTNEPFGTFKKVTVENIDITVDDGAVRPSHSIQPQTSCNWRHPANGPTTATCIRPSGRAPVAKCSPSRSRRIQCGYYGR